MVSGMVVVKGVDITYVYGPEIMVVEGVEITYVYGPEIMVVEGVEITYVYGPEEGGESQVESLKI